MLVDDDRDLLRALSIRLRRQGFNVLLAGNGTDGFWRAVQEQPDVVVADCNMPGGSGEHLITRLKDEATTAHIPVVVLTGGSWQERPDINHQRDLTGRRGAVAYLESLPSSPSSWPLFWRPMRVVWDSGRSAASRAVSMLRKPYSR